MQHLIFVKKNHSLQSANEEKPTHKRVNFVNFKFSSLLLSPYRLLARLNAFLLSLHSVSYHSLYLHDFVEFILLYDLVFSMLHFLAQFKSNLLRLVTIVSTLSLVASVILDKL